MDFGGETLNIPKNIPHGGLSNLQIFISNTLTIFIVAGAFLLVIYIVWAGIQMIIAHGDKNKVTAARGRLTWAIIGFIIILSSFFILDTIGFLFKVNLLKLS